MKNVPLSPVTLLDDDERATGQQHRVQDAGGGGAKATSGADDDVAAADADALLIAPYVETQSPRQDLLPRFRESSNPRRSSYKARRNSSQSHQMGLPGNNMQVQGSQAPANPYTSPTPSTTGALRPGGPVNLLSRENAGLLVNYYAVGIFNGILPGLVYPFFKIYLGLEGYQSNATDTLLMFAWYFKFVFGIISDCMPVFGYRRKPYIIGGWCCVLVIMSVMALNPVVEPHRFFKDGPVVNEDSAGDSPKYVIPLMLVTIGYLFADVSCDGLMVEFAQREFEHMRGRAQLTVYGVRFLGELSGTLLVALGMNSKLYNGKFKFALTVNDVFWIMAIVALLAIVATVFNLKDRKVEKGQSLKGQLHNFWVIMQQRATWQIVLYGFLQKLSFAFDVSPANAINQHWLHVDPFTKNLFRSATTGIYAAGSFVTHKYLLNVSWRATMLIAIFSGLAIGLPSVLITVFDVYRNMYFYLAKDQLVGFFDCLAMMVRILVIVEIAEPGFESSTYGLVTTVYNLAGPMSIAISNYIGSSFDVYDEDIETDSSHVRWQVASTFFIMYGVRVFLNLAVLPLLPRQKREAKALKLHGGSSKRVSGLLFGFFALVFVFAISVNLMSIFESTACLKIVGGEGCNTCLTRYLEAWALGRDFKSVQPMGAKQSKLKKELAALKEQATLAKTKYDAEVEALKSDKRELQFKLNVLQELTAQAQLEAEKATQAAVESEERMKALKWELVRKLTVSTSSSSSSSTSSSSSAAAGRSAATSLAASESASPRVALSWKLRDGVELRRSASTMLSTNSKSTAKTTRPHAQSEPALPHKQTLTGQEPPTKSKPQDYEKEQENARSRSDAKMESGKSASVGKAQNSNNEEKEVSESATTALQSVSTPSSSLSPSENESRSKYSALSRKKSTQGLDGKAAAQKHEERRPPFSNDADGSSSSEPESEGNKAAREAAKDRKNPQRTGKLGSEGKEFSLSDDEVSS